MIALIGLLLGVFLGLVFDVNIPESFSPYMSVAILACLDSVFGAFRASLNNNFKSDIFISGFFGNAVLAILLTVLGEKLNIDIYLAAIVVFVGRMFNNLGIIRRYYVEKWTENVKNKSEKNKDKNKEKNEEKEI